MLRALLRAVATGVAPDHVSYCADAQIYVLAQCDPSLGLKGIDFERRCSKHLLHPVLARADAILHSELIIFSLYRLKARSF